MNQTSIRDILNRLPEEPLATLRAVKHNLTGHELRKIEYIQAGLLPALDNFLSGGTAWADQVGDSTNDAIWSNAANIVSVLANTGPAFVQPILETSITDSLLACLRASPANSRIELALMKCLHGIADNLPLRSEPESGREWKPYQALSISLYEKHNAARLVLAIGGGQDFVARQVGAAAMELVYATCLSERHRNVLAECGLLDVLAGKLLSKESATSSRSNDYHTSLLLKCICLLTEKSRPQAQHLLQHEGVKQLLAHDIELPAVPDLVVKHKPRRSDFPPLGASSIAASRKRPSAIRQDSMVIDDSDEEEQTEEPFIPWLLGLARRCWGGCRVMAARLLGILKCHDLMHPVRARSMAILLVPALVNLVQATKQPQKQPSNRPLCAEMVPSTIALLVRNNEHMQDAAVDSKAIPKLAAALKINFETTQELEEGLWWPQKQNRKLTDGTPACRLGPGGPSKQLRLNMLMREGLLQALASIAPTKDAYRKEVCEQGALVQIIQALEPFGSKIIHGIHGDTLTIHGNSAGTLVAACATVQALTRSATALRTKLVDADIAKSVLRLLHTPEPDVRIAATMVTANLAHDFSPMKPNVAEHAVIRKLCEQAHSANARLRLESLFALKSLVNNSAYSLKKLVVEELGPNWIKQLIATDPHDVPDGEVIGLEPKEYRKGSMLRISDDAQMEDVDDAVDGNPQEQEYTRHTLQQDLEIQAELLAFVRNLTTGEQSTETIDYLLEHIGTDDFIQIVLDRLHSLKQQSMARTQSTTSSPFPETVEHTLYILAHMCAADQKYRPTICFNKMLMKQIALLLHSSSSIRCAACWVIINLIYPTQTDGFHGSVTRAKELQKLGIVTQLRRMDNNDKSPDVIERVKTALDCFGKLLDRS